ncbi:MAG: hypothetical protein RL266_1545, partial [Bacteroidota bacterium]
MKLIKAVFGLLLLAAFCYVGNVRMLGIPPVMKFIDPYHGFWQNAEFLCAKHDSILSIATRSEAQVA